MYAPYKNTFVPQSRCSQIDQYCSNDSDCLQSCPFGDIPADRMACGGTQYEKDRALGRCQAAWSEVTDPCLFQGEDSCAPGRLGVNNLYCQQTIDVDGWPNFAPTYALPLVGQGYCMPRTMLPAPPVPVACTGRFLAQMQANNQLTCIDQYDAEKKAYALCSNVNSVVCDSTGRANIGLR
jgi:hypothetical protein